jgi:hypothetical protein
MSSESPTGDAIGRDGTPTDGAVPDAAAPSDATGQPAPAPEPWPKIWIGETLARSVAVVRAAPVTLAALALPAAVSCVLSIVAFGMAKNSPALLVGAALLSVILGTVSGAALTVAADRTAAGERVTVGEALGVAVTSSGRIVLGWIAYALIVGGLVLVLAVAAAAGGLVGSPAGIGLVAIIGVIGLFLVVGRWLFFLQPIVLEGRGPIATLSRSRELTRRNTWRAIGLLCAFGLVVATPLNTLQLVGLYVVPPAAGVVLMGIYGEIAAVVIGVALTVAFGGRTGRPWVLSSGVAHGRWVAVGLIVAGLVASIVVSVFTAGRVSTLLEPDAGHAIFGRSASAADACHPTDRSTAFAAGEPIYVAAVFNRTIRPGTSASVRFYLNCTLAAEVPLAASGGQPNACYYEIAPVTNHPTGS